jgi:capsular exopolysaccharide synthesis family protein
MKVRFSASRLSDGAVESALPPARPIGELLRNARELSDAQIDRIAEFQREKGVRFGEAAVALDLASNDDVVWALSQQLLGEGPIATATGRSPELVLASDPLGPAAEAIRDLCSQITGQTAPSGRPRHALCVASPSRGDGKTFVAANLAVALSQTGARTLLIDADLRSPRLHTMFGIDGPQGLSSLLAGRTVADCIRPVIDMPRLFVLPVGVRPRNPLELLQRHSLGFLMRELLTKFDQIVVDSPAHASGSDVRVIAAQCGVAVALGRPGQTRVESMERLLGALASARVRMAGVVMNQH